MGYLRKASCALTVLLMSAAHQVWAQPSTAAVSETADMIGARVVASDGSQVGEIADVLAVDGRLERIRVRTDVPLGIGDRIVELQSDTFTALGSTVTLKMSAKEFRLLAPLPEKENADTTPQSHPSIKPKK